MANIEFEPVKEEEIPKRGKYREQVRKWVARFQKLKKEKGIKALKSKEFKDREVAMSYYDSFKDYLKKEKLPIDVKFRKNGNGTFQLFLVDVEGTI